MAQLSLTINNRDYEITCDDGQENRLSQLGAYVDEKVAELTASVGQVGEARLLVMASLILCDELLEAKLKLAAKEKEMASALAEADGAGGGEAQVADGVADDAAELLEACAARIQTIADRMVAS